MKREKEHDLHRDVGYVSLANAVIEQAARDYRWALREMCNPFGIHFLEARTVAREVEAFFKSKWFKVLSLLDGEDLMHRIQAYPTAPIGGQHD